MSLGDRVRKRREYLKLSQSELARRAGTAQPNISDLERGAQAEVTSALLKRLAVALGCTTDYLVGMYDEAEPVAAEPPKPRRRRQKAMVASSTTEQ